jgi:hypothetical protein
MKPDLSKTPTFSEWRTSTIKVKKLASPKLMDQLESVRPIVMNEVPVMNLKPPLPVANIHSKFRLNMRTKGLVI